MKKITIGILAHVDAGKTTLSEAMLYQSGGIRKIGRVDTGDAFLDTYELEKARGITIFSKQAVFQLENTYITLLDTPGHVDFSAEMERTLQVLDYAILVISGADGIQGHTRTLMNLLDRYEIPVLLFVNKMDQPGTDKQQLLQELKDRLWDGCVDFTESINHFHENVAMCDESALEYFLDTGTLDTDKIICLIKQRKVFPCYFGSALKLDGIETFLKGIDKYTAPSEYSDAFKARVFKITRDDQGNRLTYMKITGGVLAVKTLLTNRQQNQAVGSEQIDVWEEKVNQIRIYSGEKYSVVNEAEAGMVCAVTGLTKTYPGQGLGMEAEAEKPILEPVFTYKIELPTGCEVAVILPKLWELQEEEPQLHIVWNEALQEIQAQVMGDVQIEILKSMIVQRFGITIGFDTGNIVYKETIGNCVEGVGHFEPLRHYAEVHLLLEPGKPGSGLEFVADCSEELLDKNWQRLVLTHLTEKEHKGVLIGAPLTDMKITLVAGRAHQKHTEGGDFRQATYRAVRQGLMQAKSVLLEPYYSYRLEVPEQMVGRAMTDVEKMHGTFEMTQAEAGVAVLMGSAPVQTMHDYQKEVTAYTRGFGRLFCTLKGYEPCHDADAIIEQGGYDPERDLANPTGSVFCAHGSGFTVSWDQVKEYMHVSGVLEKKEENLEAPDLTGTAVAGSVPDYWMDEDEVNTIIAQTYHANKRDKSEPRKGVVRRRTGAPAPASTRIYQGYQPKESKEEYLLVDGYNVIFAWQELKELAAVNLDGARGRLMDILSNYQGIKKCNLILVFDAYRVKDHDTEFMDYHNIHVVFTKEAETADQYIEKFTYENARKYDVTVATSDGLEQIIIRGNGSRLLSSRELEMEVRLANEKLREEYLDKQPKEKNTLIKALSTEAVRQMEEIQLEDEDEENEFQ